MQQSASYLSNLGGEIPIELTPNEKFCIQSETLLTESLIWQLLRRYYMQASIEAWTSNSVPSFVTSNSRLARTYSQIVFNFLLDWFKKHESTNEPVYILELGAGHGRFTYLFLKAILRYKELWKHMGLPDHPFVYVFTDVAETDINHCENHSDFKLFVEEKWLDFAKFDADSKNDCIFLRFSKKYIPPNNPIVLIANYVLDSLLTDSWRIINNEIYRPYLSIFSPIQEKDKYDPNIMSRMSVTWKWKKLDAMGQKLIFQTDNSSSDDSTSATDIAPTPSYLLNDPTIVEVLRDYAALDQNLSFTLPIGAFFLFNSLANYSKNKLFCLAGDKGYPVTQEFENVRDPHLAVHGSVSFMVNLHAICSYFNHLGGFHCQTPWRNTFQITALWACTDKDTFSHSRMAFLEKRDDMIPDTLICWQKQCLKNLNLASAEAFHEFSLILRFSGHDPEVFWNFKKILLEAYSPILNPRIESDLLLDCRKVYDNWYRLSKSDNLADACGTLCMKIGQYEDAIFYFKESLKLFPSVSSIFTHLNLATCYKMLQQFDEGMACCDMALQIEPMNSGCLKFKRDLLLCTQPLRIAIVLGNLRSKNLSTIGLIFRYKTLNVVGLHAINKSLIDDLKSALPFTIKVPTYIGDNGFKTLLEDSSVHGFVLDLPLAKIWQYIRDVWHSKKHILHFGPVSDNFETAKRLYTTMQESYTVDSPVWLSVQIPLFECVFLKAEQLAENLGHCVSFNFSILSKRGPDTDVQLSSHIQDRLECLITILNSSIHVMRRVFKASPESISCDASSGSVSYSTLYSSTNSAGVASIGMANPLVEVLKNPDAATSSLLVNNSTQKQNNNSLRLTGYLKMKTPAGNTVYGSFTISEDASRNYEQYNFIYQDGIITIDSQLGTRKLSCIDKGVRQEFEHFADGHQASIDHWIDLICQTKNHNPQNTNIPLPFDTSINSAICDAYIIDKLMKSIAQKGKEMQISIGL